MKKILSLCIIATICLASFSSYASDSKLEYTVAAGVNLGGTAPMGFPAEVRSVDSYTPLFNPMIGAYITKMFTPKWGVSTGLRFEQKGMIAQASVKNYQINVDIKQGDQTGKKKGYYTGTVENKTHNSYLVLPVNAVYRPSSKWDVNAGVYFAYAVDRSFTGHAMNGTIRETPLHDKVGVQMADYDYSNDVNKFDFGIEVGGGYKVYKDLAVNASLHWGLLSTLNEDTKQINLTTYNIYLNVGVSYTFK